MAVEKSAVIEVKADASSFDVLLSSPPPAGLMWVAVVVALATLFWRVVTFGISRIDLRKERRLSVEDEFWFRTVIVPLCVDPLIEFIEWSTKEFRDLETGDGEEKPAAYRKALEQFQKRKEATLARFLMLQSLDGEIYPGVADRLDRIDDTVTEHCALNSLGEVAMDKAYIQFGSVEQAVYIELSSIFDLLKSTHKSISK